MTEEDEHAGPENSTPNPSPRSRGVYATAQTRGTDAYERGRLWIANQDPASRTGATIGWVRRYQAADGQLYAVLISAYLFLTLVPLLLVFSSYPYSDPEAAAKRVERRLRLEGSTLLGFFVWAPRLLLRNRVAVRDIVPGAIFTMLGLVGMRIISGLLLKHWLEWYSKSYGALGIVMAIFFWLVFAATILVLAAALSPALAHRRDLRQARPADGEESASAE
jgi:uncharacterized BrkB/YihY/UPF0761 family membrane protein